MHIMYGLLDGLNSPKKIYSYNLLTTQWTVSELTISNAVASAASGRAGTSIIIANGSNWGVWAYNFVQVVNFESNSV